MSSLSGRRIVITRATEQVDESADLVASLGATPVVVPLIEVVDEPIGMRELGDTDFGDIDWVIATSPNGARRVAPMLAEASRLRVAAVGASTAAALPRCDLVPANQSAVGLLGELPSGPGRVVVVQAVGAAPTLVDGLREKGWVVRPISPYRTKALTPPAEQRRAALDADAVLFASGSAARAWVAAFGQRTPPVVIAIGEQTAAVVEQVGLKISAVSSDHSVNGMLITLSEYFSGG